MDNLIQKSRPPSADQQSSILEVSAIPLAASPEDLQGEVEINRYESNEETVDYASIRPTFNLPDIKKQRSLRWPLLPGKLASFVNLWLGMPPKNRRFWSMSQEFKENISREEYAFHSDLLLKVLRSCLTIAQAFVLWDTFLAFYNLGSVEGSAQVQLIITASIQGILCLFALVGLGFSYKAHSLRVVDPLVFVFLLRSMMVYLNLLGWHHIEEKERVEQRIILQIVFSVFLTFSILLRQMSPSRLALVFLSCCTQSAGSILASSNGDPPTISLFDNIISLLIGTAFFLILQACLVFAVGFIRLQLLADLNQKVIQYKEVLHIIENLDIALISKDRLGIGLCNSAGYKMIQNIAKLQSQQLSSLSNFDMSSLKLRREAFSDGKHSHLQTQKEEQILSSKIFKLYLNEEQQQQRSHPTSERQFSSYTEAEMQAETSEKFSLNDIYSMPTQELESKVFCIPRRIYTDSESPKKATAFVESIEMKKEPEDHLRYVQIKHQKFSNSEGLVDHKILQIMDISEKIMFNMANAEKRLLVLINATVSHEMRNPINAIYCQNLQLRSLNEKLMEQLKGVKSNKAFSSRYLKEKLRQLYAQYFDCTNIQESSTKLLQFLVNDILDFAQIKAGKFRKNVGKFNVKQAIHEIARMLQFKAEQGGINIRVRFVNFPTLPDDQIHVDDETKKIDPNDYVVCTDNQRLQQIVMNILSNALKFTPSGGSVLVRAKLISSIEDFDPSEYEGNMQVKVDNIQRLIQQARHGAIQISVQDTGIGIKKENQGQLFKLFGFLDATKELNSKGIGLGLHISKKITQMFGGEIVCVSEWQGGSKFILFFALDEKKQVEQGLKRCKNPLDKTYPKIKVDLEEEATQAPELSNKEDEVINEYKKSKTHEKRKFMKESSSSIVKQLQSKKTMRKSMTAKGQHQFLKQRETTKLNILASKLNEGGLDEVSEFQSDELSEDSSSEEVTLQTQVQDYEDADLPEHLIQFTDNARRLTLGAAKPVFDQIVGVKRLEMKSPSVVIEEEEKEEKEEKPNTKQIIIHNENFDENKVTSHEVSRLTLPPPTPHFRHRQSIVSSNVVVLELNLISEMSSVSLESSIDAVSKIQPVVDEEKDSSSESSQDHLPLPVAITYQAIPQKERKEDKSGLPDRYKSHTIDFIITNSGKSENLQNFDRYKRIMIVDDEPFNRIGLSVILQQAAQSLFGHIEVNHSVKDAQEKKSSFVDIQQKIRSLLDKASNGQEALNLVKKAYKDGQFSYGIIFMDCSMPIMDGFEASENIRSFIRHHGFHQPMIVACTGHTEEEYIQKAWRYQMDEVISKPTHFEIIKALLEEIIEVS